jgi:hypothetical protein
MVTTRSLRGTGMNVVNEAGMEHTAYGGKSTCAMAVYAKAKSKTKVQLLQMKCSTIYFINMDNHQLKNLEKKYDSSYGLQINCIIRGNTIKPFHQTCFTYVISV